MTIKSILCDTLINTDIEIYQYEWVYGENNNVSTWSLNDHKSFSIPNAKLINTLKVKVTDIIFYAESGGDFKCFTLILDSTLCSKINLEYGF